MLVFYILHISLKPTEGRPLTGWSLDQIHWINLQI